MRNHPTLFACCCLLTIAACSSTIENPGDGVGGSNDRRDGNGQDPGQYEDTTPPGATRPPPVITGVSPLSGSYGTLVTITGDNFDEASAALVLDGPVEAVTYKMPRAGTASETKPDAVIKKWSKTEIQFKYPFPADGVVRVQTKAGQAEGGSFVPSVRPGTPLSGSFTRHELLAIVSPSPGTFVAAFDGKTGPQILVADASGAVRTTAFERGGNALQRASLYPTAAGNVEGFFVSGGKLFHLTDAMGAATTTNTGVAATAAAGDRDAIGPYAWIKNGGTTLRRVRAPSWKATAESVTDPTPSSAPGPSIAVAQDNSLYVGWGVNSDGSFPFYDHTTGPVVRRRRPGQTVFDGEKRVGGGADDYMLWTRFRPGPDGRVASYFCANDTGVFADTSIDLDCEEGYTGNAPIPSASVSSEYVIGYGPTTSVIASCEIATATLEVGPETQTAQQVPLLFPCPGIVIVAADAKGAAQVLVQSGNYVYAPKQR